MGEAAKISLKAIGKQDTYLLSKDPEDSFFNDKDMTQHSEFRKYHRSRNIINPGGLPISQSAINLHHGLIECENKQGETCFSLYLPLENNPLENNHLENKPLDTLHE